MQQIYTYLIIMISFLYVIIDKSQNTLQLKYCAQLPPTFEPITAFFIITGMWPVAALFIDLKLILQDLIHLAFYLIQRNPNQSRYMYWWTLASAELWR